MSKQHFSEQATDVLLRKKRSYTLVLVLLILICMMQIAFAVWSGNFLFVITALLMLFAGIPVNKNLQTVHEELIRRGK